MRAIQLLGREYSRWPVRIEPQPPLYGFHRFVIFPEGKLRLREKKMSERLLGSCLNRHSESLGGPAELVGFERLLACGQLAGVLGARVFCGQRRARQLRFA